MIDLPIVKAWNLPAVVVLVTGTKVWSLFHDKVERELCLECAGMNEGYRKIAAGSGYDDPRQYALEHDLTHHFLAEVRGEPYSKALHDGDIHVPLPVAPVEVQEEERAVYALQRYARTGEAVNLLPLWRVLPPGSDLPALATTLAKVWRIGDATNDG